MQYLIALFYSNFIRYYVIFLAIHSIPDCDLGSLSETSMKVEKKSELIGRGGFYRRPVGETRLIRSTVRNWRPGKFFLNFKDTKSREEHKTIFCGFRISGRLCPIKVTYRHFSVLAKSI